MQRITRLVFLLEGVVVSQDPEPIIQPEMTGVLDNLYHRFELLLVSNSTSERVAAIFSKNYLAQWFKGDAIYLLPESVAGYEAMLQGMVDAGVIIPGHSLWIDYHPVRTMLAVRQGIDASIFVNGARLYRDLWLWGIVPLDK